MRRLLLSLLLLGFAALWVDPALSQGKRMDAIWARTTTQTITLDGVLNEAAWDKAESMIVRFGTDAGIPGSGWKIEGGVLPTDSTYATLKFLVKDNQMYLGAHFRDKSVGGSKDFNRFDGLLMALKDRGNANFPKPVAEYLYAWWYSDDPDTLDPGQAPGFMGRWGNFPPSLPRTPEQIAAWDAVTVVNGLSNSDATPDNGYTVEMRFDVGVMGYTPSAPAGDIIEWNLSIYDCDFLWPLDPFKIAYNRIWLQSPWGNTNWYNEFRIYARPNVTVDSGPVPYLPPEYIIPSGDALAAPVIDGQLNDAVWADVPYFDIEYGNDVTRAGYPSVGKYTSGQYQPPVNGGQAFIEDPGRARVKMFVRGTKLFVGFDVNDLYVQYHPLFDRYDGFIVSINERIVRDTQDKVLKGRRLTFQVNAAGGATASDYLPTLVGAGNAAVAISLKPGTVVDTTGANFDTGYTAELSIELTALGYPANLGDRVVFLGVDYLDGDSFQNATDSYATRTWWFREHEGNCCAAWAYLSQAPLTGVDEGAPPAPEGYHLLGAYPNPSYQPTLRFSLLADSRVTLDVVDVAGRLVDRRELGTLGAGTREYLYDGSKLSAGLYLYQVNVFDPVTGVQRTALPGRLVINR